MLPNAITSHSPEDLLYDISGNDQTVHKLQYLAVARTRSPELQYIT